MTPEANPTTAMTPDAAEPRAGLRAVPVGLFVLLFVLLYWGMVYFEFNGGWFDQRVYTPYHSYDEVAAMWPPSEDPIFIRGKELFKNNCAVCHMETGVGNPANGCPPLVGSEWVAAPGAGRVIRIVSKGLTGPIKVKGQVYNTGTMLAVGDQLPGDEKEKAENIAAILSYVRKTFGNNPVALTAAQVAAVRAQIASHRASFTPEEVEKTPETE